MSLYSQRRALLSYRLFRARFMPAREAWQRATSTELAFASMRRATLHGRS